MLPFIDRGATKQGFFLRGCTLGPPAGPLRPAPGNQPPDASYLCVVPLADGWRGDRALTGKEGVPHFADALEPPVLDDLRDGRALLVLDLSNEGPTYSGNVFDTLHDFAVATPSRQHAWSGRVMLRWGRNSIMCHQPHEGGPA